MNRKVTKEEFKGIRNILGLTQVEMADLLDVSVPHIARTEGQNGSNVYGVSEKLDKKLKEKLESMDINIQEIIKLIQ